MALSADPAETAVFTLETVDGRKLQFRSTFLTRRQRSKHRRLCAELEGMSYDDDIWSKVQEILAIGIVGVTFEELEDRLSERDIVHLAMNYPEAVELRESELGKSRSRLRFATDESVNNASEGGAATPQPNSTPSS